MSEIGEFTFWNTVIEALEKKRENFVLTHSGVFTEEYFKEYEDNLFHEFGRINKSLNKAKSIRDTVRDKLEFVLAVSEENASHEQKGENQ